MITYLNGRKGQSTLEYAVLIIIIIAALIAIQTYIKRGVQGRLKSASDDIGDQFSPGNTNVIWAEKTKTNELQSFGIQGQGVQSTKLLSNEETNTIMKSSVAKSDQEYWGK